ncbi:18608_t:CDS:2, partial [Racocetra persica]
RIVVAFGLSIAILLYASTQLVSLLDKNFLVVITEEAIIPPAMPGVFLCASNLPFATYTCNYNFMSFIPTSYGTIYDFPPFPCEESNNSSCIKFWFNSSFKTNFDIVLMSFNITLAPTLSTSNASFNLSEYLFPHLPFISELGPSPKYDPSFVNFSKI